MSPPTASQTEAITSCTAVEGWAAGVFAATGMRLPEHCLKRCLNGNGNLAQTHGCAMVKALSRRRKNRGDATLADLGSTPLVCGQGFGVSWHPGTADDVPDVLVLHPAVPREMLLMTEQASRVLRAAMVENWRLNRENDALADEVLHGYEQINFVFDVSSQISVLHDARQIRQMLLIRLRDMFNADAVFLVSHSRGRVLKIGADNLVSYGQVPEPRQSGSGSSYDDELADWPQDYELAAERLSHSAGVFATDLGHGGGHGTTLWGAIKDGGKELSVVAVVRKQFSFVSGDMLLLDSALTFGGNILSNLRLVERLKQTSIEAVRALVNAIDAKDQYTCGHSERVGFLARVTGEHMGLPPEQVQELEWAGLLHDVGKIGIPESVLNKPGQLTPQEYQVIKGHPAQGFHVLKPVESLEPVLAGVLYHHENPDGTGYPRGLCGDEIPLIARIVHVVDVFDALTSTRSYRAAFDPAKAIDILERDAGTKLDRDAVDSFLGTWQRLPSSHPAEFQKWFGPDAGSAT